LSGLAPGEFDVVIIECSLSVCGAPGPVLREAVNALAPGGALLIADLCDREEAKRVSDSAVVSHGRVSVEALIRVLREAGLALVGFEDRSRDLDSFAAEKIFEHGSLEAYYASAVPESEARGDFFPASAVPDKTRGQSLRPTADAPARPPGYFLAIFRKERDG
jgi:SAM-dependent methyltransferase